MALWVLPVDWNGTISPWSVWYVGAVKVSSIWPTMVCEAAKAMPPANSTPATANPATNPSRLSLSLAFNTTGIYTRDSPAGIARLRRSA